MQVTLNERFERTDIWREGKWLDLWSVVHFLTGMSLGLGATIFKFGSVESIIIVFLLLVSYEMWEAMVHIVETPQNRFMDVVVGMTSFVPTFFFVPMMPQTVFILTFGLIFTVNVVLATFGWLASRKADVLEARLRLELTEQRAKFAARRARRRARRLEKRQMDA